MYTKFTNRNIQELFIVRHGIVKPEYELTDKVYSYGKLAYKWLSMRRKAMVETADEIWNFKFESVWKTSMVITDKNEEVIGRLRSKIFSYKHELLMNNGFAATFRKTSFWKSTYVWESNTYGPIIRLQSPAFSSTDTISIEQSNAPADIIPLLAFLGIHLIIIRRQREAAAASS